MGALERHFLLIESFFGIFSQFQLCSPCGARMRRMSRRGATFLPHAIVRFDRLL
jgi:hypothetical protein